ncbi:hypothetical protein [Confluentibacter lentus]|uniref:hypothetical protein n=1 Tax=Confluentibacter lentus TaxID=1699412 RepID=UPI000C287808|nr:hypothetical protein [Confluentibacter lentus]
MRKNKLIFISLIIAIFFSCKEIEIESKPQPLHEKILNFNLPDTLYFDELTDGHLTYNVDLDTISPLEIHNRYIYLHLTVDKKTLAFEEIKKSDRLILLDTVGNGNFNFKLRLKKTERTILNIAIEDIIIFKPKINQEKVKIRTNEVVINKVMVIEAVKKQREI